MAPKDKTVTLQSVDICSALLARLDTQRERYKNMRKKKIQQAGFFARRKSNYKHY